MNLVRTVIQNAPRIGGGEQQDIWDGRDENGSIVPNGVYFYRVDIGSNEPIYGKIMVLM
jgi:flagellar hook assembly protein FlgD